jgi:hypothetical protein
VVFSFTGRRGIGRRALLPRVFSGHLVTKKKGCNVV